MYLITYKYNVMGASSFDIRPENRKRLVATYAEAMDIADNLRNDIDASDVHVYMEI